MRDAGLAFQGLGFGPADMLLPNPGVDLEKWAVVACDQFTSQPAYWQEADRLVGDAPSTLRMVFPEACLGSAAEDTARVLDIQQAMRAYLEGGVFAPPFRGFVLVARETEHGRRLGLVGAVDLEAYDFTPGSQSAVRATEETILERLPARTRIRRGAALELPHVLLLADDAGQTLTEPFYAARARLRPLYDTPLMQGGGRVRGWAVEAPEDVAAVAAALAALPAPGGLRLAVGDGNHSLAAARACWLEIKKGLGADAQHPARYALAELCNVYDEGIVFEPIHRVLFGVETPAVKAALGALTPGGTDVRLVSGVSEEAFGLGLPPGTLAVAAVQAALDAWLPTAGARIDYIHGDDALRELAVPPGRCGILLGAMPKEALFPAIARGGVLPRKAFSMGHAWEKRYYLECRRLDT